MITPRLELRALEAFAAVTEAGSFRAAARSLGYTQSAISYQVAALERRLDARLFARPGGRRRVTLTPLGELAYVHAQRVLAAAQALEADMTAALAGERGTLRIGITQGLGLLLADPLARVRQHSPGIEVSLTEPRTPQMLIQQIRAGEVDVGFYINVEPDEHVSIETLFEDTWVLLTQQADPLANLRAVGLDVLDGADMIAWHQRWQAQTSLEQ